MPPSAPGAVVCASMKPSDRICSTAAISAACQPGRNVGLIRISVTRRPYPSQRNSRARNNEVRPHSLISPVTNSPAVLSRALATCAPVAAATCRPMPRNASPSFPRIDFSGGKNPAARNFEISRFATWPADVAIHGSSVRPMDLRCSAGTAFALSSSTETTSGASNLFPPSAVVCLSVLRCAANHIRRVAERPERGFVLSLDPPTFLGEGGSRAW
jgi:hypothetical protein